MTDSKKTIRKFITVPMDEELHKHLKALAEKDERSIVSQIRLFVKKGLAQEAA